MTLAEYESAAVAQAKGDNAPMDALATRATTQNTPMPLVICSDNGTALVITLAAKFGPAAFDVQSGYWLR